MEGLVEPEAKVGRPKKKRKGPEPRFKTIAVRATEEWGQWAEEGASHCHMNLSTAIDIALTEFFKSKGYDKPRPRRY